MQILAIDIGMGTQDILLYDSEKKIENCYKMVLPSPTYHLAQKVKSVSKKDTLILTGNVMGGGHISMAVKRHLQQGGRVFATPNAALTLHDNLETVKKMGVEITDHAPEIEGITVHLSDVNPEQLNKLFTLCSIEFPDIIAVAVQDHGFAPHMSNRIRRFEIFKEIIKKGGRPEDFAYTNPPDELNRLQAVASTIKTTNRGALVMDTGPAAIRGAMLDPQAENPSIVINIGNGHTIAAVVKDACIVALFEHHTSRLNALRIDDYIQRLSDGTLTTEEIFNDTGHGCYINEIVGFENIKTILVTGPNRDLMKESGHPVTFATPFGDMMISGCFGLVDTWILKQCGKHIN